MTIDTHAFVSLMAEAGPVGVVGIAIAEKIFPLVPSYLVFVLLGITVAWGQGDLTMTVASAAIGSTIGSLCWYGLGFALGAERSESFVARFGHYIFLKPTLYRRIAEAYRRNHFWVTVVGQTIPVVRVYLSIPAGVINLAVVEFTTAILIGSLTWTGPLLIAGYVLQGRGSDVATSSALLLMTALVGLELLAILIWRLLRAARQSSVSVR
ncbi:membrane protein DedA with SNARE-associated domain [Nitrobacteraceae bacterium AZCC 1564]